MHNIYLIFSFFILYSYLLFINTTQEKSKQENSYVCPTSYSL